MAKSVSGPVDRALAERYVDLVVKHECLVAPQFSLPGGTWRPTGTWIQLRDGQVLGQEPYRPSKGVTQVAWSDAMRLAIELGLLIPVVEKAPWLTNYPTLYAPAADRRMDAGPDLWAGDLVNWPEPLTGSACRSLAEVIDWKRDIETCVEALRWRTPPVLPAQIGCVPQDAAARHAWVQQVEQVKAQVVQRLTP